MASKIDMKGKRFGRLVVIEQDGHIGPQAAWLCKCDCGLTTTVRGFCLRQGATKSCGCLQKEGRAIKQMAGQRFGRWLVKSHAGHGSWLCVCDCGSQSVVSGKVLRLGSSQSCGCLAMEWALKLHKLSPGRSRKHYGVNAPYMYLRDTYISDAIRRDLSFELSDEDFISLTSGVCFYCLSAPRQVTPTFHTSLMANGIDRLNSSLGYSRDNCVSCCSTCNMMKRSLSVSDFISKCCQIADIHSAGGLSG